MIDRVPIAGSVFPREDFPILGDIVYLNQAAIGLVPEPVLQALNEFTSSLGGGGSASLDDAAEAEVFELARRRAADLMGATAPEVAIVGSATEAMNQLAWGLDVAAGQNVVSVDIEFPSVTLPWIRAATERNLEVRLARVGGNPAGFGLGALADVVDDKTAAIVVSWVQYATGHLLDLNELLNLSESVGAILIVDASQAAGVIPIDVRTTPVDALITAGYKWLLGPIGAAACYLSPRVLDRLVPAFVGWRSAAHPYAFDATHLDLAREARRLESTAISYTAGLGLGSALEYLARFPTDRVRDHCRALGGQLQEALLELGAELVTPADPSGRAGIISARVPGHDSGRLAIDLGRRGIQVGSRVGGLRFAVHGFNDESDIEAVMVGLRHAMAR